MADSYKKCVRNGGNVITITGPNENYGLLEGEHRDTCTLEGEVYTGPKVKDEPKEKDGLGVKVEKGLLPDTMKKLKKSQKITDSILKQFGFK